MDSITIFAVDVGSPKNFAWVCDAGLQGKDGDTLTAAITKSFATGQRIALGFECPLFIPVPRHWDGIGKARVGEGNRSWSAGGGATVTTYGLHEVAWILARLRETGNAKVPIFFSPEAWLLSNEPGLLLWEAFVTGSDKGRDHVDDAQRACRAFLQLMKRKAWDEASQVTVGSEAQSLNLAALAAEWAGWPIAATERNSQLLVVKPAKV
jgi:hypothetical protein